MTKPKALNHAAFRVTNVEKARDFYENVIGLKQIPRPQMGIGGAWYGVGEAAIHIISADNPMRVSSDIDPTGPHIAIEVEDYEAAKQAITQRGLKFQELKMDGFGALLWVHDPDGNTIELRAPGVPGKPQ
jgi:glyoxylase I family protein